MRGRPELLWPLWAALGWLGPPKRAQTRWTCKSKYSFQCFQTCVWTQLFVCVFVEVAQQLPKRNNTCAYGLLGCACLWRWAIWQKKHTHQHMCSTIFVKTNVFYNSLFVCACPANVVEVMCHALENICCYALLWFHRYRAAKVTFRWNTRVLLCVFRVCVCVWGRCFANTRGCAC